MASPTPKQKIRQPSPPVSSTVEEVVDPRWLLKALALTIGAAVLCAYLAICLLVYQGGWQLMLTPVKTITKTPALPYDPIRFDSEVSGVPRLTGWWIPAGPNTASARTLLYLHDGKGSLSDSVDTLMLLHAAHVNVFAIDYRGFGQSDSQHPTEARMQEDAEAALTYLQQTRHIMPASIVPAGVGLGASLAATLVATHADLPAAILDNPDPDAPQRPTRNSRARLLPMKMLVGEHFDVAAHLAKAKQPRLLIAGGPGASGAQRAIDEQSFFRNAAAPKLTVTLATTSTQDQYVAAIVRFLDEYVGNPGPDTIKQETR